MGMIIIFSIIGVVVGLVLVFKSKEQTSSLREDYVCGGLMGGVLAVFLGVVGQYVVTPLMPVKWVTESPIKLVSFGSKSSVEGSFILGSGDFGEKEYFLYYRQWGEGFKKEKLLADNSVIFEGSPVAMLVVKKQVYKEEWMNFFFLKGRGWASAHPPSYEFYVPKGTVIQKFSVE